MQMLMGQTDGRMNGQWNDGGIDERSYSMYAGGIILEEYSRCRRSFFTCGVCLTECF